MSNEYVQSNYEQLDQVAQRFGKQAELTEQMLQRLKQQSEKLRSSWEGKGATAFTREMSTVLLPAVNRLFQAQVQARNAIQKIKQTMTTAESEAASLFRADGSSGASAGASGSGAAAGGSPSASQSGGMATPVNFASAMGGGGMDNGGGSGGASAGGSDAGGGSAGAAPAGGANAGAAEGTGGGGSSAGGAPAEAAGGGGATEGAGGGGSAGGAPAEGAGGGGAAEDAGGGAAEGGAAATPQANITFGPNANQGIVSEHTRGVLNDILQESNNDSATITSTARTVDDQARIMYGNIERQGVAEQKRLYGRYGDQVIDAYVAAKAEGKSEMEIRAAMVSKINELGPTNVSKHLADPNVLNVIDVSPSSITNREEFEAAVRADPRVSKFLTPSDGDPAYHIEITQPQPAANP